MGVHTPNFEKLHILNNCCLLYANYTSTQYFEKKKSCKKLQLADGLQSQSLHLWGLLRVHTDVSLLLSCSQPVAEHGRDTSAGPVPPRAAWPGQSCTASQGSSFLPALLMPVSDLHCGLRLFFFFCNFIYLYLFLAILSLCCCTQVFPGSGKQGLLSSCGEWASHRRGFFCCWAWAPGTWAQLLWHMGLVAGWHMESSWTRGRTRVPCIGRQVLNHWTTWEVQGCYSLLLPFLFTDISARRPLHFLFHLGMCFPEAWVDTVSSNVCCLSLQFFANFLLGCCHFFKGSWDLGQVT